MNSIQIKNFLFKKNTYYRTINILFDYKNSVDIKNLYLFLKYYTTEEKYFLKYIFIVGGGINNDVHNITIFHNINVFYFKKMNFFDFKEWFENLWQNDWMYMQSFQLYGFSLSFFENSFIWTNSNWLPPLEFDNEFIKLWFPYEMELNKLSSIILNYKKKIKNLEKNMKNYKKSTFCEKKKYRLYKRGSSSKRIN